MTEAEWFGSDNLEHLLACLVGTCYPEAEPCNWGSGERKKLLFLVACADRIRSMLPSEYRAALHLTDPDAPALPDDEREALWDAAEALRWQDQQLLFALGYDDIPLYCAAVAQLAAADPAAEQRRHRALLRDVFGNPFRPVTFDSAWRSPTVVSLAQAIYAERRFADVPILADALEEAGCANADVLRHCRTPAEHVRGCWVVDLARETLTPQ